MQAASTLLYCIDFTSEFWFLGRENALIKKKNYGIFIKIHFKNRFYVYYPYFNLTP